MSAATASVEDLTPPESHTKWRVAEGAALTLVVVAVWGLLLLPLVFAYVPLLQVRCSFQCSMHEDNGPGLHS